MSQKVDDKTKEKLREHALTVLDDLVQHFYEKTNLSLDELPEDLYLVVKELHHAAGTIRAAL